MSGMGQNPTMRITNNIPVSTEETIYIFFLDTASPVKIIKKSLSLYEDRLFFICSATSETPRS